MKSLDGNFDFKLHARYTGIFDFSDPGGPVFGFPGSSITVNFIGSELVLRMKDVKGTNTSWINVIIDGAAPAAIHIKAGQDTYVLAEGLAYTGHKVEICKKTEAYFGYLQFMGMVLPEGGAFLSPPAHLERKIEFIGDSITCGDANEAADPDNTASDAENNYTAYGSFAARMLNAEQLTVAASGTGCYQNYGGTKEGRMSDYYMDIVSPGIDRMKSYHRWMPDVVVINLGTNDFSADIDTVQFRTRYEELVRFVRSKYSDAFIFCVIGPMNITPGPHILSVVNKLNREGDGRICYMEFPLINIGEDGIGGAGHPSVKTHLKMAEQLAEGIKNKLNW